MSSQQQASNTPVVIRDLWSTPQWLFNWAKEELFDFDIDLAANEHNRKCEKFISQQTNSLEEPWHLRGRAGWCNPPYSDISPWLKKAWVQAQMGFRTVLLVPTPNGENHYKDWVFGKASEIIFINGRISFIAGESFTVRGIRGRPDTHYPQSYKVNGNTRGSCLIVYNKSFPSPTRMDWVNREDMKEYK